MGSLGKFLGTGAFYVFCLGLTSVYADGDNVIFEFPNRTQILRAHPNNHNKKGLFTKATTDDKPLPFDQSQSKRFSHVPYLGREDRIALVYSERGEFFAFTAPGYGKPLHVPTERLKVVSNEHGVSFEHHTQKVSFDGKQFWIVQFPLKSIDSQPDTLTYVINEQANVLKIEFGANLLGEGGPEVRNGVVQLGTDLLIDLSMFDVRRPTMKHYRNGSIVSLNPGLTYRVAFENDGGTKELFADPSIAWTPQYADFSDQRAKLAPRTPLDLDLFVRQNKASVVTSNGQTISLPVSEYVTQALRKGQDLYGTTRGFIAEGKHFLLVNLTVPVPDSTSPAPAQTLLIDEDGNIVRVDFRRYDKFDLSIEDSILKIAGSPRNVGIDLRCMKGEAAFVPQLVKNKIKPESSTELEPSKAVDSFFSDFAEKVSLNPGDTFEFDVARGRKLTALLLADGGSAAIIGPAGGGKSQVMKDLVAAIKKGTLPGFPRTTRFLELRPTQLSQGASLVGMFQARVEALIEYSKIVPTFLIGDEFHALRGQGTHSENQNDLFQYLKPGLAEGHLRALFASTVGEYRAAFGGDEALQRRVPTVSWPAPNAEQAEGMAFNWMAAKNYLPTEEDVVRSAVTFSNRLDAIGAQPSKAIKLIRYTYGFKRSHGDYSRELSESDLKSAAVSLYELDPDFFSPARMFERAQALPAYLAQHLAGNDGPKEALANLAIDNALGLIRENGIAISVLLAGPPGGGKTTMARVFAEGIGFKFAKIDMTEFSAYGSAELFAERFAAVLNDNPHAVILLDELGKASFDVQERMLNIMTDGTFEVTRALGSTDRNKVPVTVDASKVILFATTNAGAVEVEREGRKFGFAQDPDPLSDRAMREIVITDPQEAILRALADRFSDVLAMSTSKPEEVSQVVDIQIGKLLKSLLADGIDGYRIEIENEADLVNFVTEQLGSNSGSNRDIPRLLKKILNAALREQLKARAIEGLPRPAQIRLRFDRTLPTKFSVDCRDELLETVQPASAA